MKRLLLAFLACLVPELFAAGTVTQTITQAGTQDMFIVTLSWVADSSDGSVPTTVLLSSGPAVPNLAGYWVQQVITDPGSPSPTANYDVALVDTNGQDILGAACADRSATLTETCFPATAPRPTTGLLSLTITNQGVNSATGVVQVFFATKPVARRGGGAPTGAAGGVLTGSYPDPTLVCITALGDLCYGGAAGAATRLAGNTTTTPAVLVQTGTGSASAAPAWTAATGTGAPVLATSPTITTPIITSIVPGANFTLSQNSVAPFTSVASGAVANTLYLSAGNVGIGTTGPGQKLQVVGADGFSIPLAVTQSNDGSGTEATSIGFGTGTSGEGANILKAGIGLNRSASNGRGNLEFYNDNTNDTSNFAADDLKALIPAGGGFAVTASRTVPNGGWRSLTVRGSPLFISQGSGSSFWEFWKDEAGVGGLPTKAVSFGLSASGGSPTDDLYFNTFDGTTWSPRITVLNASGNVGIANTVPGAYLTVGPNATGSGTFYVKDGTASTGATRGTFALGAADSATTVTLTNEGTTKSAGYQSSDGSPGVTVTTCTSFKNGLCVAGT